MIIHLKTTLMKECKSIEDSFRDKKDNYLLGLCNEGKANYLVSGDLDVLESNIKPPPFVIKLNEFLKIFD